jgi:anti-sigma-K factor RskA
MTADVHTLAGAYALDALPDDERNFFERHLAACEACRHEVDELRATAAALGAGAAEPPPATLRARVLAAIDVTRQLPPLAQPVTPDDRPAVRSRAQIALASVAAALALLAGALGWTLHDLDQRFAEVESELAELRAEGGVAAILAAADRSEVRLETAGDAVATFVYSPALDRGVFVADGLEPLSGAQTYELWLYHDGRPHPVEVFDAGRDGVAEALVADGVVGAEVVAVTVEPHGGTAHPTGEVVASAQLPA